jgi:hypothetical protein
MYRKVTLHIHQYTGCSNKKKNIYIITKLVLMIIIRIWLLLVNNNTISLTFNVLNSWRYYYNCSAFCTNLKISNTLYKYII